MLTLFLLIQLIVSFQNFAIYNPPTLTIVFDQVKTLIGFKYLNINWILGQIQEDLSLNTLFMSQ